MSAMSFFYRISAIPRGSGNEAGIADFLVSFAEERGLFCVRDEENNVFIKKPASAGCEGAEPVLLQGHTDMVCEKNSGTEHDFLTEPLKLKLDGDTLYAEGTTLGADDGTAVALMLELLDDKNAVHPPLECLFTTAEETGLTGAKAFDCSLITASRMLNLDSETEGEAVAGCAGGARISYRRELMRAAAPMTHKQVIISLSGFAGGHSGADIDLGRANANRVLAELLAELYDKRPFMLRSVSGGSADNAIPREAEAVLLTDEPELCESECKRFFAALRPELTEADHSAKLRVNVKSSASLVEDGKLSAVSFADTAAVIAAMLLPPIGPLEHMTAAGAQIVKTSANLGIVSVDGESAELTYSLRSNVERGLEKLIERYFWLARSLGVEAELYSRYPGWQFSSGSALAALYRETYSRLNPGREARIAVIHAGLECGIISEKLRNLPENARELDIISIGPDIRDIHTPSERLSVASFERTCELVREMLLRLTCGGR